MNFKEFVREKINYYILHFKKKRILLDLNGDPRHEVNLSFDYLSDLYLTYSEENASTEQSGTLQMGSFDTSLIKITDEDLV
jgi:hypothetical protein